LATPTKPHPFLIDAAQLAILQMAVTLAFSRYTPTQIANTVRGICMVLQNLALLRQCKKKKEEEIG
jgi:hypothetical protein